MSDGRWVWVPEGWRVVPEVPTEGMCSAAWNEVDTNEDSEYPAIWMELKSAINAAPEPPSGWRQGNPPSRGPWLGYDPALGPDCGCFCGYFGTLRRGEWWTQLPPPPEVKP